MPGLSRLRALPWMIPFDLVMVARDRWGRLDDKEREELGRLAAAVARERRSPTARERDLLRTVAGKLDILGVGRDMLPRVVGRRRR